MDAINQITAKWSQVVLARCKGGHHHYWIPLPSPRHRCKRRGHDRHVHFADDSIAITIGTTEYIPDCWIASDEINESKFWDDRIVESSSRVQNYLNTIDDAYLEVINNRRRRTTTVQHLMPLITQGVDMGFRALERSSIYSRKRIRSARDSVDSIVDMYHRLKDSPHSHGSLDIQLCKCSQNLSRNDQKWAQFLGEIDALAAIGEYVDLPPTLPSGLDDTTSSRSTKVGRGSHKRISLYPVFLHTNHSRGGATMRDLGDTGKLNAQ